MAASISCTCMLPVDVVEMMKLNDDQQTQLSESTPNRVSVDHLFSFMALIVDSLR